jgi:hypothetical protein
MDTIPHGYAPRYAVVGSVRFGEPDTEPDGFVSLEEFSRHRERAGQ